MVGDGFDVPQLVTLHSLWAIDTFFRVKETRVWLWLSVGLVWAFDSARFTGSGDPEELARRADVDAAWPDG